MAQRWKKWIVAAGVAQLFQSGEAQAAGLSIRTIGAHELRIATIGHRIAVANWNACAAPLTMSGLVAHDLTQYPIGARTSVSRVFSLGQGIGVLGIIPGSGAARAGFKVDDEILRIGTKSVEEPGVWSQQSSSYRRMDVFLEHLSRSLASGPKRLLIRRSGRLLELDIVGQKGCGGAVKLVDSPTVNAWSDGRHVVLSSAIVRIAGSDDELAFVIAHEMAHNVLGHSRGSGKESRALFGRVFGSVGPRSAESQADAAAVSLLQKGGFTPEAGIAFLQSASRRMWWAGLSVSHPGFGRRMRVIADVIRRDRSPGLELSGAAKAKSRGATVVAFTGRSTSVNGSGRFGNNLSALSKINLGNELCLSAPSSCEVRNFDSRVKPG